MEEYEEHLEKNLKYIRENRKSVIKKLKEKYGKEPLKAVFYIYDAAKWKSQTVYDLMVLKDKFFDPLIVVTRSCAPAGNCSAQTDKEIRETYKFFKNKGMNVKFGYDFKKNNYIPFKNFNPDIILYSHPWYVYKTQGPVMCSRFALTYYIPYFLPNTSSYIEYDLRFHQYVYKHYVLDEVAKNFYHEHQTRKSGNLVPVGHPQLDYFYLNPKKEKTQKTVIYAPHWAITREGSLSYSTFLNNGEFILEFARKHTEINWVFKPHPILYKNLISSGSWTEEKALRYWNDWKSIGMCYESGDYLDIFNSSYAMITDCGSFLTEYLLTENPVIHLVSSDAAEYNENVKKIVNSYYQAHNIKELKTYLEDVILNENDFKKQDRIKVREVLKLGGNYCAQKILKDITKDFL